MKNILILSILLSLTACTLNEGKISTIECLDKVGNMFYKGTTHRKVFTSEEGVFFRDDKGNFHEILNATCNVSEKETE